MHCAVFHGFRAGGAEKFPASLVIDREIIFAFELIRKTEFILGAVVADFPPVFLSYCEFCIRILALSSRSVRACVDKRHMSIYANIHIDFEH